MLVINQFRKINELRVINFCRKKRKTTFLRLVNSIRFSWILSVIRKKMITMYFWFKFLQYAFRWHFKNNSCSWTMAIHQIISLWRPLTIQLWIQVIIHITTTSGAQWISNRKREIEVVITIIIIKRVLCRSRVFWFYDAL